MAITGQQTYAISLERVKRIFDFFEARIDIRQRQYGKQSEPAFVIGNHPGAVVVHIARKSDRFRALFREIIAKPDARFGTGKERGLGAALIHRFDRSRGSVILKSVPALPLDFDDPLDPAR